MEPSANNSDGSPISDAFHYSHVFVNMREYIKDMNHGDVLQIMVNSMIPLSDNDVFKLNGKYDHDPSGTSIIIQASMMVNPVNAKGKRFICRH